MPTEVHPPPTHKREKTHLTRLKKLGYSNLFRDAKEQGDEQGPHGSKAIESEARAGLRMTSTPVRVTQEARDVELPGENARIS